MTYKKSSRTQNEGAHVLRKAVFLDRDGTLNCDEGHYYIYKPEDVVFNPGVMEGLKRLKDAGYLLFIVTNQGGVAKGIYTHEDVKKVHDYMCAEFGRHGISIDKIYYCPHHESVKSCICRKPSPYMINLAAEEFQVDRKQSWLIGDGSRDIKAAEAAGIKSIKIHKNQDLTPAIDRILGVNSPLRNMNLDESEF
ncbi:MAG: HAD family hydrolase [Odoribacter sp.]|nr:HAD family hydrolase [Odoribacter sp.]